MARFALVLPEMGEYVEDVKILRWKVQVGDWVPEDLPVVEIAADKVDAEIPMVFQGRLVEILAGPGRRVRVGEVLAIFESER
jgi:pyruvate/2-oxoglutarate dehydrogenase complex dihydrolipoamide acyltransferase (E2) component